MAITVAHLATAVDDVDRSVYTTASIAPTASRLIVAIFNSMRVGAAPTAVTPAGNGLTWLTIDSHAWNTEDSTAGRETAYIFAADTGASPSAGTMTFTHAGPTTHIMGHWSIFELNGTDVANGVAQSFVQVVKSTVNATGSSFSLTLAAAGHADNRPFCAAHLEQSSAAITDRTNWTNIGTAGGGSSPPTRIDTQWRSDTFETTASASWTGTLSYGAMAFEIKAAVAATGRHHLNLPLLGVG